ncbi:MULTISPECIES: hypothetical protein [Bacillus cereus group]|nr:MULTISPECIES: hypothetical protein [Bacillus cereus group]MCU7756902.1 hypothetical protein [Bacillus cereus]MDC7752542.1 hypothetical protein [Bacillus cereus]MDF9528446.1 hypothetical protein [Bacillus cereus]MDG1576394.1 hypothetical protein [Bacillus cereus]
MQPSSPLRVVASDPLPLLSSLISSPQRYPYEGYTSPSQVSW